MRACLYVRDLCVQLRTHRRVQCALHPPEHTGKCALKRLFAVENKVKHESLLLSLSPSSPPPLSPAQHARLPSILGPEGGSIPLTPPPPRHDGGCHCRYKLLHKLINQVYSPRGDPLNPEDEEEDEDEEAVATTDEGSTNSARTKQANDGMITKRENCLLRETGEAVGGVRPMLGIAEDDAAFPVTSAVADAVVELGAAGVP